MDAVMSAYFKNLEAKDKTLQYEAFQQIISATHEKVNWAYDVWDELKTWLTDQDNHKRARAAQFLSNLAISDPEKRIIDDFQILWGVTKDPKFVTARHSLQAIWRVGLAGVEQKNLVIDHFENRFRNGDEEKHHTLIRFDMIQGLRNLYDVLEDESIKKTALNLIELERDSKYKKKYLSVWK